MATETICKALSLRVGWKNDRVKPIALQYVGRGRVMATKGKKMMSITANAEANLATCMTSGFNPLRKISGQPEYYMRGHQTPD